LAPFTFAFAPSHLKIELVTTFLEPNQGGSRVRTLVVPLMVSVICLTLIFTVQDAMRRSTNGLPMSWSRSLKVNGIDWGSWGAFVPIIAFIGRRHRLDRAKNRLLSVAIWTLMGVTACVAQSVISGVALFKLGLAVLPTGRTGPPQLERYLLNWTVSTFGFNMIIFLMIVGAFHAALYYRDLRARRLREMDLATRLARAELNVLRMQLQPHFFFNALHTISALMISDVPAAHRVITSLGDLLRSSIDHTANQEITLREELAFVGRYVEIQRARFRNRLDVQIDVGDDVLDALVPSFVLQPLVENAIRHGIEPHTRGGRILIRAVRRGPSLGLMVQDDGGGHGTSTAHREGNERATAGVGLTNIEARLSQLYGEAQRFRAGRSSDGCFSVELTLPLHMESGLFPAVSAAS
jgi:fumarate reductase subunit D